MLGNPVIKPNLNMMNDVENICHVKILPQIKGQLIHPQALNQSNHLLPARPAHVDKLHPQIIGDNVPFFVNHRNSPGRKVIPAVPAAAGNDNAGELQPLSVIQMEAGAPACGVKVREPVSFTVLRLPELHPAGNSTVRSA